jgi:hypothetical protein
MNWIEKVRQKPQEEKIRLIKTAVIAAAIILAALWVLTSRFSKNTPKDTTLFQTIGQGIKDVRNNFRK